MKDRVLSIYVTCLMTRDVVRYNVVYRVWYWVVYMNLYTFFVTPRIWYRLQVKWKQKSLLTVKGSQGSLLPVFHGIPVTKGCN